LNVVYHLVYYENQQGEKAVKEYIETLNKRTDKDARIKSNKIAEYLRRLQEHGTGIGEPTVDKIEGTDLWELRPLSDRIFFAYWKDNIFVLLHHFVKKTNKTPKREIKQAERYLKDWKGRYGE
jgi:phage-related protein